MSNLFFAVAIECMYQWTVDRELLAYMGDAFTRKVWLQDLAVDIEHAFKR